MTKALKTTWCSMSNIEFFLQVYEGCVKWQDNKDNLNATGSDLLEFEISELFNDTMKEISARLGWSGAELLTVEQIKDIYDMCRFDKAWNNSESELSPWCFVSLLVPFLMYFQ